MSSACECCFIQQWSSQSTQRDELAGLALDVADQVVHGFGLQGREEPDRDVGFDIVWTFAERGQSLGSTERAGG